MLRLKNLKQDESRILSVEGCEVLVPFVPAGVELLLQGELSDENVNKVFHILVHGKIPEEIYRRVNPLDRLRIIRSLQGLSSGHSEKDDFETVIDMGDMLLFLAVKMNIPKNELLSRFSLIELIQITSNLKGDRDLPFFKHQKIASSIEELKALLG